MTFQQNQGRFAEQAALDYLNRKGLRLVERNFRCRGGELDLIMTEGDTLVFVEVRYRASSRFGTGADSVDRRKQQKMIRAAAQFLRMRRRYASRRCRFDVISATRATDANPTGASAGTGTGAGDGTSATLKINWIRSAFDADG